MDWCEKDGIRWLDAPLPGARAAFTTRPGGVSAGPYESLNLGLSTGDDPGDVRVNRERLGKALGRDPTGVLTGRQVHGANVAHHDEPQAGSPYAAAQRVSTDFDGHATADDALTPFVMAADCLPIALAGPGGVAMVHGGWRGLAAGIIERGVAAVGATGAAIGPGIGRCCYQVGDEVLASFSGLDGVADGRMLDLTAVAGHLLEREGITEADAAELCTRCNPDLFFSHRRDGERTGRHGGLAWIER